MAGHRDRMHRVLLFPYTPDIRKLRGDVVERRTRKNQHRTFPAKNPPRRLLAVCGVLIEIVRRLYEGPLSGNLGHRMMVNIMAVCPEA